ncbi:TXNDC9 family protein [Megaselia abdita]
MANMMDNAIMAAAQQIEKQLDQQLDKLDTMKTDDLQLLREQRLREMKELKKKQEEWIANGHGVFSELADEKEFFEVSKKSPNIVCHFYRDGAERCRIVDMHLKILAQKHIEARFCKVNAEKSPFLTQRLRIKVIPTIALIKDSKTRDYIVGFTDLGNCDDFSTEMMEWRIARSEVIDYKGDLMTPPDVKKSKPFINRVQKTIRGREDSDSDIDFSD